MLTKREKRLRNFEANFGRDFGWFVEADTHRVAILTNPVSVEMFWVQYDVTALASDGAVFTDEFWSGELVYRNRVTGEIAEFAFTGGQLPTLANPTILMRALYSSNHPSRLESVLLFFRRLIRRGQRRKPL